jgi:hypothetical protein
MAIFQIIHQITLPERMDGNRFEEFMRDKYFPAIDKQSTRIGQVTGLALLRGVSETHNTTNTFLMHVSFDGTATGHTRVVDEEVQSTFEFYSQHFERLGAYEKVAVWPEDAEA